MALYAIGDLHLSLTADKPMEVFGPAWENYTERNGDALSRLTAGDVLVLAGDTSWAMKLEDCSADFAFLQNLPGRKLLLKGNHDYWWTTMAKMNAYLAANGFGSLSFLHNNCVFAEGLALCGTRSWLFDAGQPHDEKVMSRECGRLRASLEAAGDTEKAVFLHYPPVYPQADAGEVVALLREYGVKRCFYGHLHGPSIPRAVQGELDGIEYKLISADALRFFPYKI